MTLWNSRPRSSPVRLQSSRIPKVHLQIKSQSIITSPYLLCPNLPTSTPPTFPSQLDCLGIWKPSSEHLSLIFVSAVLLHWPTQLPNLLAILRSPLPSAVIVLSFQILCVWWSWESAPRSKQLTWVIPLIIPALDITYTYCSRMALTTPIYRDRGTKVFNLFDYLFVYIYIYSN